MRLTLIVYQRINLFADRMMKERVLSKGRGDQDDDDIEEKFTDDEESEDEAEGAGEYCTNPTFCIICTICILKN